LLELNVIPDSAFNCPCVPVDVVTLSSPKFVIVAVPLVPEEPELPEVPDEPELPEVPEEPAAPELPDEPEVPDEPELPEEPDVPEVPDEPEFPEVPELPEEPLVPEEPELPDVPLDAALIFVSTLPLESTVNTLVLVPVGKLGILKSPSIIVKPEPLTDRIGTPEISDAANTVPVKSSVTENN
jgi:hypothetical protein